MNSVKSLEPQINPANKISFLLDWELTLKCNLDCSYCATGIYGGHDNTTRHPPVHECLPTIDIMFEYADIKMQTKPQGIKYVVLNVYGGESLYHPNIVEILQKVREKYLPYQHRWHLTITTTTNAIVSPKKLTEIIPLIDEFTVSYHSESSHKQKLQFKSNLLSIKNSASRLKCVVLMHGEPAKFQDSQDMIKWLDQNSIKYLPRQLDNQFENDNLNYNSQQVTWFEGLYKTKLTDVKVKNNAFSLSDTGRACCGGRSLCADQQMRSPQSFVTNSFPGWFCSVNHFFLFVKQVTGDVYVNKDCKMNFEGIRGAIGSLDQPELLLQQAHNSTVIQCANTRCYCGLCAPKAEDLDTYRTIMKKYEIPTTNLLHQT